MSLDENWFTEECEFCGTAFSLRIKGRLHEEQSEYQHLEIYDTDTFGKLMVLDGCIMLTTRDNFLYHEMMSHPALFTHSNPKKVLIIGGGDCGTLKEVLKHPGVEEAHLIEIDEAVTRAAEQYFPELCTSNNDPRAKIMFIDGIQWIADTAPGTYDVIIVDSTDPVGPAKGLFTEAFYRNCHRALGENGIIVQQSESPLIHTEILREMRDALRSAGYQDLITMHFPQPVYPSGWWSATLALKEGSVDSIRERDILQKGFHTKYYNLATHRAVLSTPEFLLEAFNE